MSDTPETDDLARGNHVVPTEWAQQLERERDKAREDATNYYAKIGELKSQRDDAREMVKAICKNKFGTNCEFIDDDE